MKIKKKITSVVLSGITAISATLSCLPIYTYAAGGFSNISDTTYQLCSMFGDLYDENSYISNAKVKENNIPFGENEYRKYCNDVVDGYNFAMSQNFNTDYQTLYRDGKEYDPSSTELCKEKNFFSYDDTDVYGAYHGGGYSFSDERSVISVLDTSDGGRADAGYGGYCIDLQKSDKGNLSYLYRSCGTYTDENKLSHDVDVKVTVVDYEETTDVCVPSSTTVMFTQDEYNKMSANQKQYLTKLKTAVTYKKQKYVYTVPYGYLSQASSAGVFSIVGRDNKYYSYKGAAMRFTPMRVGIDVCSVNWIELKYEFFEAGTNTPIYVKGYSCWKDIDGSQGVSFPEGTMDKVGAWESSSHFLAHTFTKDGVTYNGYFDRIGTGTKDDDSFAWLYGTFSGKELTTLFSFCGRTDPTDPSKNRTQGIYDNNGNKASNYGEPRLRRNQTCAGTIMNDLPSVSLTGTLGIKKYIQPLNGDKYLVTPNNAPDINKDLRFYLKDSKGHYVKLEKGLTEHGEDVYEISCAYKYIGTTEKIEDAGLASLGKQNVTWGSDSVISIAGGAIIYNLPIDTYTIYETTADNSTISKKIDLSTVTTANMSVDNNGNSIWDTVNPNAVDSSMYDEIYGDILYKYVDVVNPENYAKLNIQKTVTTADGTTQNAAYSNAEQLLKNIKFSITNDKGEFAQIENNKVIGFSQTASFFTLNGNGQINDIIIPFGKYTLNEHSTGSNVSNIWNTNKSVDFELNKDTCNHETAEIYNYSVDIDNPELYGAAKVIKTTPTGKDITGIRFTLSGTSDSGRSINLSGITDSKGQIIFNNVPVGTYILKEDPETVPKGYKVAEDMVVLITKNSTSENNVYTVNNEPEKPVIGNIYGYKYDRDNKQALANAEFTLIEDVNGNGKYDKNTDWIKQVTTTDSNGNFFFERLTLSTFLVKETKAPEGYAIDNNYYPVTIDKDHLEVRIDVPNTQLPVNLTLTKRIPVNELNGQIWFEHGNPTFIFKVVNTTAGKEYNRTYYKTVEFTKDYVKDHTITIDGSKYVEMSVSFDDLKAGTYTASEQITGHRYKLKSVFNVSNGTVSDNKCNFTLEPGQTGKATFFNVKNSFDTNTHNSLCVNVLKK